MANATDDKVRRAAENCVGQTVYSNDCDGRAEMVELFASIIRTALAEALEDVVLLDALLDPDGECEVYHRESSDTGMRHAAVTYQQLASRSDIREVLGKKEDEDG